MAKDYGKYNRFINDDNRDTVQLHEDHKAPITRREFLSAGLIKFSAMMILPSIFNVLANSEVARAACAVDSASGLAPLITLNLSGGAALNGNFVPHDKGGQLLSSYNLLGLGQASGLPIEMEMGAPFAGMQNGALLSNILRGIRSTANASTLANTALVGVSVLTHDDTAVNKLDISGLAVKAGLMGSKLPNMGNTGGKTGISQQAAFTAPPAPLIAGRYSQIQGALGMSGAVTKLSKDQQVHLISLINKMSDSQAQKLAATTGGEALKDLVHCGNEHNKALLGSDPKVLDPRSNSGVASVWQIGGGTADNNQNLVFGAMTYNVLNGAAPVAGLNMGGYDYHNNTRSSGNSADLKAGQVIGRILQTAAVMNKKLFLYVTTDGHVVSAASDDRQSPWRSDRGTAGGAYMIAYDPAGRPKTSHFQLGYFNEGQAADTSFLTGGTAELAAGAVFMNYLKFSGQVGLADKVLPNVFTARDLDTVLRFA